MMNSALAAEETRRLDHASPGLKPDFSPSPNGAAKAAPLQNLILNSATLRWTWWTLVPLTFVAAVVAGHGLLGGNLFHVGLLCTLECVQREAYRIPPRRPAFSYHLRGESPLA